MGSISLNDEDAVCSLDSDSEAEMEGIVSALLHPDCKLRNLKLELRVKIWEWFPDLIPKILRATDILVGGLASKLCHLESLDLSFPRKTWDIDDTTTRREFAKYIIDRVAARLVTAIESEECSLQSLNMAECQIGSHVRSLSKALESPECHLKSLNLGLDNVGIGSEGIKSLVEALSSKTCHLKSLNLGGNKVGNEGVEILVEALESENCHLISLNLENNGIRSKGIKSLVKALGSENCHLVSLRLRGNAIGISAPAALGILLESKTCCFQFLDLNGGAKHKSIAKAELVLSQNSLCFSWSQKCDEDCMNHDDEHDDDGGYDWSHYDDDDGDDDDSKLLYKGWRILVNALVSKDCHVQALDMVGYSIGEDNLNIFFQALTTGSCQLKSLVLQLSGLEDARNIAKALQSPHCQLEHLIVYGSEIEACVLGDALQSSHCKLQTFSFIDLLFAYEASFQIYDHVIARVADALHMKHCKLRTLELEMRHSEDVETHVQLHVSTRASHFQISHRSNPPLPSSSFVDSQVLVKPHAGKIC